MRKITIFLSAVAFIAGGCGQSNTRKQVETTTKQVETNIENTLTTVNNAQTLPGNTYLSEVQTAREIDFVETALFNFKKIDSTTYFALKEKVNPQKVELERIRDFEQVRKMLEGRVTWCKYGDENQIVEGDGKMVCKIVFRNGETFSHTGFPGSYFVAYYPEVDVLVLEGGHTSDESFNLTTGETREITGIPWNYVYSQSRKYLLNGWHDGDVCKYYFIQEKIDGRYQTTIDLYEVFNEIVDFRFCWAPDAFWENDTALNIIVAEDPNTGYEKLYYQIILK